MILIDVVQTISPDAAKIIGQKAGHWLVHFFYKRDEAESYLQRASETLTVRGI